MGKNKPKRKSKQQEEGISIKKDSPIEWCETSTMPKSKCNCTNCKRK